MYVPASNRSLLVLRRSGLRGLGQANCPSQDQLLGINDCSDPCQASASYCLADLSTLPVTTPGASGTTIGSTGIPILGNVSAYGVNATAPSILSSITAYLPFIIGGVMVFAIVAALNE